MLLIMDKKITDEESVNDIAQINAMLFDRKGVLIQRYTTNTKSINFFKRNIEILACDCEIAIFYDSDVYEYICTKYPDLLKHVRTVVVVPKFAKNQSS